LVSSSSFTDRRDRPPIFFLVIVGDRQEVEGLEAALAD
jgi:hypothetical protein